MGVPDDIRRRPQPLAMANDASARARPSLDTYYSMPGSPGQQYAYYNQSPSGYSTPTSTAFSTSPGSPHYGSPPSASALSRSSFYDGARHAPGQRPSSVPSATQAYQNATGNTYPPTYFSPIPSGSSMAFRKTAACLMVLQPRSSPMADVIRKQSSSMAGGHGTQEPTPSIQSLLELPVENPRWPSRDTSGHDGGLKTNWARCNEGALDKVPKDQRDNLGRTWSHVGPDLSVDSEQCRQQASAACLHLAPEQLVGLNEDCGWLWQVVVALPCLSSVGCVVTAAVQGLAHRSTPMCEVLITTQMSMQRTLEYLYSSNQPSESYAS
ncbi:Up in starvation [Elasticomyces elasticus]|nr:Up in starvation [Elasticomyces elasticus]KAK4908035.1 Up in starvation [Elasticomyces elasticus]